MKQNKRNIIGKREKSFIWVITFILAIILFSLIGYARYVSQKEKKYLMSKTDYITCKVIGRWRTSLQGNIFEYKVNNKTYKTHWQNYTPLENDEFYLAKYSLDNPEYVEIDLTRPVIKDTLNYVLSSGTVLKIESKSEPNRITFSYKYDDVVYKRKIYIRKDADYVVGRNYEILIKIASPKISYINEKECGQ